MFFTSKLFNIIFPCSLLLFISLICIIISIIHYLKHNLKYHAYNRQILKKEKSEKTNLINKKIRFKSNQHVYISNIKDNVSQIEIINDTITNYYKAQKNNATFENLKPLIDVRAFNDPLTPFLLINLIKIFKPKRQKKCDKLFPMIFGNNYIEYNKNYLFFHNQSLIYVIISEHLAHPQLINFEQLDIKVSNKSETKNHIIYSLTIKYHQKVILSLNKKILKTDNEVYETLVQITDNYSVFARCSSIKETLIKYAHLQKINEQTLQKINDMSGQKFLKWIQKAMSDILEIEIELRQAKNNSYYLFAHDKTNKTFILQAKRRNDKINSTMIKELKEIQGYEDADEAYIITNNEYTTQALELAKATNVHLLSNDDIVKIVHQFNNLCYKSF